MPGQEWHKSAETGREPRGGATSQQRKGLVFPPQAPVDTAEHVPVGSPPQILERRRTPKAAMCPNPADGRATGSRQIRIPYHVVFQVLPIF